MSLKSISSQGILKKLPRVNKIVTDKKIMKMLPKGVLYDKHPPYRIMKISTNFASLAEI